MSKIRWGIFGTGAMAHRFSHDMTLSETGILAGVASRQFDRATAFSEGVQGYEDYQALAKSSDIDAIYIATPNSTHHALSLMAIEVGKPVLCEKPVATTAAEAEEIAHAAEKAGVFVMEALWTCFLPGIRSVKSLIDDGSLGELLSASATLGFARAQTIGDPITDPKLGGGATLDLGVYCVSLLHHFLGPSEVAMSSCERSQEGGVRSAFGVLKHPSSGAILSTVTCSHDAILSNRLEIVGRKGRIEVGDRFIEARDARQWHYEPEPYQRSKLVRPAVVRMRQMPLWPKLRSLSKRLSGPSGQMIDCSYRGTGLQFQIDEVGTCIRAGRTHSEILPIRGSVETMRVLEQLV